MLYRYTKWIPFRIQYKVKNNFVFVQDTAIKSHKYLKINLSFQDGPNKLENTK